MIVSAAKPGGDLHSAVVAMDRSGEGRIEASRLGYSLRRLKNRIVDGLRIERVNLSRKGTLWRVAAVLPDGDAKREDDVDGEDEFSHPDHTTDANGRDSADPRSEIDRKHLHDHRHLHGQGPDEETEGSGASGEECGA